MYMRNAPTLPLISHAWIRPGLSPWTKGTLLGMRGDVLEPTLSPPFSTHSPESEAELTNSPF